MISGKGYRTISVVKNGIDACLYCHYVAINITVDRPQITYYPVEIGLHVDTGLVIIEMIGYLNPDDLIMIDATVASTRHY